LLTVVAVLSAGLVSIVGFEAAQGSPSMTAAKAITDCSYAGNGSPPGFFTDQPIYVAVDGPTGAAVYYSGGRVGICGDTPGATSTMPVVSATQGQALLTVPLVAYFYNNPAWAVIHHANDVVRLMVVTRTGRAPVKMLPHGLAVTQFNVNTNRFDGNGVSSPIESVKVAVVVGFDRSGTVVAVAPVSICTVYGASRFGTCH